MEGYAPHSRSHFRAAPPPPSSAGAGAAIYKKSYTNGAAAGRNGFTAYDDVFGGPPKFGATPFAPRADDYSEIFGSFRSGRASSIPMLDLPPVDDSVAAFEALGCSGFEYSEIFGGFEFADFAVSYDELFRRSDVSEDSSDDAWTPVGTGSLSEESDPFAYSGRNQYFLNGEFHETNEDTMFNVSYNKVYQETREDSELFHEAQLSSVPGYTYVVEGSTTRKEDEERYSSGVADDIILCEDSSGNISVETPWKTSFNMSYGCVVEQSHEFDKNAGGAHGFGLRPSFISVSDVSLRTDSSHLSPPSRPPPTTADGEKDPASSTLDYEHGNSNTAETISEGGSVDLFDVELHAGSSSIASAAAMKEAVGRDKVKLDSAKELMKRKKGGAKDMPFMKNDLNREDNVRMVFDESISRDDELQSTLERESNGGEVYWEEMQGASEASQVLPDPMQPEDAVNGAAEPGQRKTAKNQNSYLDSGLAEGDGEWKVTTECYELVNNCNLKAERSLPDNIKIPVEEKNNFHFANVNGSTMSAKQLKQNMERIDASIRESEDSQSADETSELKDNRRRWRATKSASRNEFHEKMVKVDQDVHETVIRDHVETVKSENKGSEGDGAGWNPELWLVEEKNERRFDKAAQQVHYEKMRKEESYLVGGEVRSEDYLVLGDCDKKGKEDWWLKQNERKGTEVTAREETLQRVKKVAERDGNGRGLNDAHQTEEKKEACARKEAEAMKRTLSPRDENLIVLNEDLGQKEDGGNSRRHEKKHSDVMSKKIGGESRERENEIWDKEVQKADQCEKDVEEAFVPDYYGEKLNAENYKKHELATENISDERIIAARNHPTSERLEKSDSTYKNEDEVDVSEEEIEQPVQASELEKSPKMYDCSTMNEDQKMESKGDLRAEFKITEQNSDEELNLEIESEYFTYIGQYTLDERDYIVPEMAYECEELKSSNLPTNLDEEDIMPTAVACECEEKLENHAAQDLPMDEEKVEFGSRTLFGEMEPKTAAVADICMETKYLQKTAAGQSMMSEREGNVQKQSLSINTRQRVGNDVKAVEGDLDAEARENAAKLKREEEIERERLRELQLAKERENERELEREHLRKLEEEREMERERELEKERLRKLEEEREREFEKERLRKLEEERERELEKERLRKLEEETKKEREKELEMLRLRRLEELRERERLKELEKDHLRKLEEENQREREKDLEMERLRKLEEEWEREREREKDRMGVESKLSAERGAVERATAEARQRAMADARERLEKACAEAREKSFGKASKEAHLRTERAAVDRATAEARERAIEKAMAERATFETRERVERSASEKFSSYRNVELRHTSSASDLWNSDKSDGVEGESAQRCKAKLERHRRTVERVSKALAEKNMRDIIAQREQAERNRLAETLDADIKRWSNGKEGNLRALLSTLQYILGPNSGWHPIPLTEVITSAAVKKAYRKATLCVHPDKLQQRGATIQQKYICEKVFDLLKDAWNRFNSEER